MGLRVEAGGVREVWAESGHGGLGQGSPCSLRMNRAPLRPRFLVVPAERSVRWEGPSHHVFLRSSARLLFRSFCPYFTLLFVNLFSLFFLFKKRDNPRRRFVLFLHILRFCMEVIAKVINLINQCN